MATIASAATRRTHVLTTSLSVAIDVVSAAALVDGTGWLDSFVAPQWIAAADAYWLVTAASVLALAGLAHAIGALFERAAEALAEAKAPGAALLARLEGIAVVTLVAYRVSGRFEHDDRLLLLSSLLLVSLVVASSGDTAWVRRDVVTARRGLAAAARWLTTPVGNDR